ncbi:MAG: hypothetical protein LBD65_05145 [Spirochaetaceae bacterium]|jgi:hypothetical protein|nr:hypothetical protein [Spirochaetaceae bacterium]
MSDITVQKKLQFSEILHDGLQIGTKNIVPIVVNALLWILTIWIPYINIGTTIGMLVGIVIKASKGESISMTEIFNPQYRKYMGEFFLTCGLVGIGTGIGFAFFFVPGCVIALAWTLAPLLVVDKAKNPMEAIFLSNKLTYGSKGTICIALVIPLVIGIILAGILSLIPILGGLLVFGVCLLLLFATVGIQASVYKNLAADV